MVLVFASITLLVLLSRLARCSIHSSFLPAEFRHYIGRRTKWMAIGLLSCGLLYTQGNLVFNYIVSSKIGDHEGQGILGTGYDRFDQWSILTDYLSHHLDQYVIGMGVGGYGIEFFDEPLAGTHNLFLDVWMEGGILALLLLILLIACMGLHCFRARDSQSIDVLSGVSVLVLFLLLIREHSPAYLAVTSMGGVCFAMIFCILVQPGNDPGGL